MVAYGQPRRLNALTVSLLLVAAGSGYWLWRFAPAYVDAWSVDHVLKQTAVAVYQANMLAEPGRTQALHELADKARADIVSQAGVRDPELQVNLDVDESHHVATVSADYHVVITLPGIDRTTALHFQRARSANIERVKWE
jgi:hypothetical protein